MHHMSRVCGVVPAQFCMAFLLCLCGMVGAVATPTISITSPINGTGYIAPATITLTAEASDPTGVVNQVIFYEGTNTIGTLTAAPYTVTWNNVATGIHTVNARVNSSTGFAIVQVRVLVVPSKGPIMRCVRVSATVARTPAAITLNWMPLQESVRYLIYRKTRIAQVWGNPIADIAGSITQYVDTAVRVGDAWEYMIVALSRVTGTGEPYTAYGFIYAGIDAPMIDGRGTLLLLVDNTIAGALDDRLVRLQEDLRGDGWTVIRHDVSRTQSVRSVKRIIQADYAADPAHVKAVLLFGHVPVPYSGNDASARHEDALGANPADVYYADMDGVWTDTLVNHNTGQRDPRYANIPGDGKFDQTLIPSDTELQISRIDLANMATSFPGQTETSLLQRYLDKDHTFRHGQLAVQRQGTIVDQYALNNLDGGTSSLFGWRNFTAFFGQGGVDANAGWFMTPAPGYLWGNATGGGDYTTQSAFGTTTGYQTDPKVVFATNVGSYCGDWDHPDDILRAPLCTTTYGLGCGFGGPFYYLHATALGDTIGAGMLLTENNDGTMYPDTDQNYYRGKMMRRIWLDWMGDGALRLNPVIPPSGLMASVPSLGTVDLNWTASTDQAIQGYLVYRAPGFGAFTRLTATPITATTYHDAGLAAGSYTYQVRAVKLETNGSGTYINPSQGIYATVNATPGTPAIALRSPLAGAGFMAPAGIILTAAVDAAFTGTVEFYNGATLIGSATAAPYRFQWDNVSVGQYTLTAKAIGAVQATSQPVTVTVGTSQESPLPGNWTEADLGATGIVGQTGVSNGTFTVTGAGAGLQGTADAGHYVFQPLLRTGQIIARLTAKGPAATAGLVLRAAQAANAPMLAIIVLPDGTAKTVRRLTAGGAATPDATGTAMTLPCWLKIRRQDATVSAFTSTDGATWTPLGASATLTLDEKPLVGLFISSGSTTASATATFDTISAVSDRQPSYTWFREPLDGETYAAGAPVVLDITKPFDDDDIYSSIAFYEGSTLVGGPGTSRSVTLNNVSVGTHAYTTRITDSHGLVSTFGPVTITINPAGSNPPTAAITYPIDGAHYLAPATLACTIDIAGNGTAITQVEYRADGAPLGTATTAPYNLSWTNIPVGTHTLVVRATNALGAVTQSLPVNIYVKPNPLLVLTGFTASPPTRQFVNQPVSLTATAVDPANVEYSFRAGYTLSGVWYWSTLSQFSTINPITWTPTAARTYTLVANARKAGSTDVVSRSMSYTVVAPLSAVSLAVSKPSPQPANTSITLTATPTGGTTVQYQFRVGYVSNGVWTWTTLRNYATSPVASWTPTVARTYTLVVSAREAGSTAVAVTKTMSYAIAVPLSAVNVSATPVSPQPVNTAITLTATPTGGSTVQYQFRAGYVSNGVWSWTTLRNYATGRTVVWTPASAHTYTVVVYAREQGDTVSYRVYKTMGYTVTP